MWYMMRLIILSWKKLATIIATQYSTEFFKDGSIPFVLVESRSGFLFSRPNILRALVRSVNIHSFCLFANDMSTWSRWLVITRALKSLVDLLEHASTALLWPYKLRQLLIGPHDMLSCTAQSRYWRFGTTKCKLSGTIPVLPAAHLPVNTPPILDSVLVISNDPASVVCE